jgi:hypothetical protein
MSKKKPKVRELALDPEPKGKRKAVGGADHDEWNDWLTFTTAVALPVNQNDEARATEAAIAAVSGMVDMKPADPIEGIIISQLIVAHQASLSMYQRAWAQPSEYFAARTKYLALADKAARTVAILTERLDHHRGRGQQKIVVQHTTTTVNADQAVVTTGNPAHLQEKTGRGATDDPALLTAATDKPMEVIDGTVDELVGVGVGEKKE